MVVSKLRVAENFEVVTIVETTETNPDNSFIRYFVVVAVYVYICSQ